MSTVFFLFCSVSATFPAQQPQQQAAQPPQHPSQVMKEQSQQPMVSLFFCCSLFSSTYFNVELKLFHVSVQTLHAEKALEMRLQRSYHSQVAYSTKPEKVCNSQLQNCMAIQILMVEHTHKHIRSTNYTHKRIDGQNVGRDKERMQNAQTHNECI